ncbi:MAG: TetR/AcrR family transcriptional regulator [Sphaerochaetaceae bacterium]|nr:TetR/AcrR family transcriptional regulator [Sphaerochaetaceae bacterium]
MPKKVDHEKRKEMILKVALEVFARDGYDDSKLSDIAKSSSLSRATLYQYFQNKEDIYYYALKQSTEDMFVKYSEVEWTGKSHPLNGILDICDDIMDTAARNIDQIRNLIVAVSKIDQQLEDAVYRRTAKLQHLIRRLLRSGIRDGVISDCDVDMEVRRIVILLESYCFQLTYFSHDSAEVVRTVLHSQLEILKKLE